MYNPSSPGGGADVIGRLIQQELTKNLGQTFIVDNRPGAANIIATELAAKSTPDGYSLLMGATGSFVTNPLVYKKLSYAVSDFIPISMVADAPFILSVHPSVPANNLAELISYAKANPGKLSFASFGNGSSSHMAGEYFQILTGTKLIHVPYKGSAPGMADLLAGNITMTFDSGLSSIPNIQAKKIRPIAVAASKRLVNLPEVPTFAELGIGNFYAGSWYGFFAPVGTPREIVNLLNKNIHQIVAMPEISARIQNLGATVQVNTPEEYSAQIAKETEQWAMVIQKAKIQLE
ncbi:MFS transporter [Polynucleobacter sp. SHI8]|nr:MFS transporter [Polynucleobacter sp. SHI2]BDW13913.1 MFS transporter [Polynucleobacter sp. SHI8]